MKYRLLLSLCLFITLLSCNNNVKVGILFDDDRAGRFVIDKQFLLSKLEEKGMQVMFQVAEGDPGLQIKQAQKMIDNGVDVLIVLPQDLNKTAKIVELAHKQNVKVISYDRLIKNCEVDFYISFDNVEVGRLQAEYLTKSCPTGNYAIIGGATSDNNSFLLRIGQMNVLQPLIVKGDINIVYDKFVNEWSKQQGYEHMKKCLETNSVNAVVAANDQIASGVIQALDEIKTETKVYVSGQDASIEACRNIYNGKQAMTVYKPIETIAEKTAELAFRLAKGDEVEESYITVYNGKKLIPTILLPPVEVNKATLELTVIADGFIDPKDLY